MQATRLMTEINNLNDKAEDICYLLRYKMSKLQKPVNVDEWYHPVNQFILASANLYCISHIIFMYHALCFSLCTFTLYFSCFTFLVVDRTQKQTLLIKRFNFAPIKDRPSVCQSNLKVVTAENEKQYTLSNIIYIKFHNCWVFFPWGPL